MPSLSYSWSGQVLTLDVFGCVQVLSENQCSMEKASLGITASVVSLTDPELWSLSSYSHLFHLILPAAPLNFNSVILFSWLNFLFFCICLTSHPNPCSSSKKYNLTITNLHLTLFSCDTHRKGGRNQYSFLGFIHHWFRDRLTMRLIELKLQTPHLLGPLPRTRDDLSSVFVWHMVLKYLQRKVFWLLPMKNALLPLGS